MGGEVGFWVFFFFGGGSLLLFIFLKYVYIYTVISLLLLSSLLLLIIMSLGIPGFSFLDGIVLVSGGFEGDEKENLGAKVCFGRDRCLTRSPPLEMVAPALRLRFAKPFFLFGVCVCYTYIYTKDHKRPGIAMFAEKRAVYLEQKLSRTLTDVMRYCTFLGTTL